MLASVPAYGREPRPEDAEARLVGRTVEPAQHEISDTEHVGHRRNRPRRGLRHGSVNLIRQWNRLAGIKFAACVTEVSGETAIATGRNASPASHF